MADEDEKLEQQYDEDGNPILTAEALAGADAGSGASKRWLIIGIVVMLLGGIAGGGWYWWQGREPGTQTVVVKPLGPAIYLAIDPPLVTNFESRGMIRFLQSQLEIMSRDPAVIAAIQTHMPAVRNQLLMLMQDQTYERISTRAGREAIRADALEEVRKVLREMGAPDAVEAVYFTSFVMQ